MRKLWRKCINKGYVSIAIAISVGLSLIAGITNVTGTVGSIGLMAMVIIVLAVAVLACTCKRYCLW